MDLVEGGGGRGWAVAGGEGHMIYLDRRERERCNVLGTKLTHFWERNF